MSKSKEEFTEQREYYQHLEDLVTVCGKRVTVLKSTVDSQKRIIDTLEQLMELKEIELTKLKK